MNLAKLYVLHGKLPYKSSRRIAGFNVMVDVVC